MSDPLPPIKEVRDVDAATFRDTIVAGYEPVVLRGLVSDWPVVEAARRSDDEACDYLKRFDRGAPVGAFVGPSEIGGRYFYRPDMTGFNFERRMGPVSEALRGLLAMRAQERPPSFYVGASATVECLPGFERENRLPLLDGLPAVQRIWIGNRSVVSAHFDASDNVACVVGGRRRFTLFPPEQVSNLYIGPLEFTMAGQPSSMVDFAAPDFGRFPRFREALKTARVAELEPGDAIYIPTLWWHHIEALSPLNILINYWWDAAPAEAGSPFEAMVHGLLTLPHLPPERRKAWRAFFDYYVFREGDEPAGHLEPKDRGILGPPTPQLRQRIRQFLLGTLGGGVR